VKPSEQVNGMHFFFPPVKYISCGFISTSTLLLSYCSCKIFAFILFHFHVHAIGFGGFFFFFFFNYACTKKVKRIVNL
jgi:hypothetical protein